MSFGFELHHILPTALFNDVITSDALRDIFGTGDQSICDYYGNRFNLFSNDDMSSIVKQFSIERPSKMDVTNFFGSVTHKGSQNSHPEYNKFVIETVKDEKAS